MDWSSRDNKGYNLSLFQAYVCHLATIKGNGYLHRFQMLGHRELKTTQIYAKIIDQTKREAADKIQLDF